MENLTADVIVEAYAKYQLFHFWQGCGLILGLLFLIGTITVVLISCGNWDIGRIITASIFGILTIAGFTILTASIYKIDVVLKPEIAKCTVSAGFDLADKVGKEVYEIWGLLKELLKK